MTPIDLLIALFVVLTVLRGARTGLLAGAFSLVGVVVGASIGSRVAPYLMPEGENPLFGAGITLVSILAFAALGEFRVCGRLDHEFEPCLTGARRPRGRNARAGALAHAGLGHRALRPPGSHARGRAPGREGIQDLATPERADARRAADEGRRGVASAARAGAARGVVMSC